MRLIPALLCLLLLLPAAPAAADPGRPFCTAGVDAPRQCIRREHIAFDTCQLIAETARSAGLDPHFFARLLWQESRFDFNALSPAGAQGIAQFMPGTAKLRGLPDSYDPALAVEASARYLAELATRYGNLGLAAVAYNGGERRADGFVAKTGGLAGETIAYVRIITGLEAEDWRDDPAAARDLSLEPGKAFLPACLALAKTRRITPFKNPKPNLLPWGVQMAAADSAGAARKRFDAKVRPCQSALDGKRPDIIRKKPQVAGRKTYYVARIGMATRGDANGLCMELRRKSCACAVYRN